MADKFRIGVVNPKKCGVGSEIPCNADEFCNGDAVGPICEPCRNHPTEDSCDEVGLPAEGAAACKARCPFDEKGNREEEEEEEEPGYWCCSGQSGGPSYLNETVCDAHCGRGGECFHKPCLCAPEGPGPDDDWPQVFLEGDEAAPFSYANRDGKGWIAYHDWDGGSCREPQDDFFWEGGSPAFCVFAVMHIICCAGMVALNVHAVAHATALRRHFNGVAARGGGGHAPPHGGQVGVEMAEFPQAMPVVVPVNVVPLNAAAQSDWLSGWLADLDGGSGTFTRHAPAFRACGFDSVPALAALTEADLVQMDVPVGHRRVILARVRGGGGGKRAARVIPLAPQEPPRQPGQHHAASGPGAGKVVVL